MADKEVSPEDIVIKFPCDYPVKVIGESSDHFLDDVFAIVRRHDPDIVQEKLTERPSRKGTYTAISIQLRATGESQLKALFEELKLCAAVRMGL